MAPRRTKPVKKGKVKKTEQPPIPAPGPTASSSVRNVFRPIPVDEGLENMMGDETDDLSEVATDVTNQSQPNFSFLPSRNHSSPHSKKRNNIPTVHQLASMSTVPNSDLVRPDTSDEPSTSYSNTASRRTSGRITPAKTTTKKTTTKRENRKQKTPAKLRLISEIINLQGSVNTLIPKLCFGRVIREILAEFSHTDMRVTAEMLICLQEAAEIYAVQVFEDAYRCTIHRGRVTLIPKDMQLALMIRRS